MAIDQKNISASLRMMDDRVLQQYAAMHKNDPYIFPLAFQESQNRKALNASKAAQMGGQEMPKVNDAALMAMAPQAAPQQAPQGQGISNLPAPNMQRMADGGIAGYEDDEEGMATGGMGGMFNFAQQSEPVVRMAGGGHIPRYQGVPLEDGGDGSMVDEFKGVDDQIAANMERQKLMGAFDDYSKPIPRPKKGSKADKKEDEAKKEDTAKKPELPALPTYKPKTAEEMRAASDLMAKPELEKIQSNYKPFAEQFAQDRARIEGREKNAVSDLLIRGGLKAMAGKSQFAMQNLGEGGLEALNAYQEGQKTNEASRRALTQSEMLMGQAQRAEERGAKAEAASLFAQADKSQQAGIQFGQKAEEIKNSKAYQDGSLIIAKQNADSARITANAALSRANALNAPGGKGAMTESQLARVRDSARDNITKDANFPLSQLKAERAAKAAGKPFDATTWLNGLIDTEVERMLANTSRASTIQTAPTGGKLGSGTFNLGSGWGQPEVVTPKK
jgi:hypothetical protein